MVGSQVASAAERRAWWNSLAPASQDKLTAIYDTDWLASMGGRSDDADGRNNDQKIAYLHLAYALYEFIEHGAENDAHIDDSYSSFAPLLLRAAFHSSGSYFLPNGSGGSKGGTIYHHGELSDAANGCIGVATEQLQALFAQHDVVPLSDAIIVAGTVALDVMDFPRMDLVRVAGGRDRWAAEQNDSGSATFRDRLPSADDDPLALLTIHYGLTLSELTAFVGGAHNFGAAHGKCSGYVGQWTATPVSWFGPPHVAADSTTTKSPPTFFSDLLRDDWRWYEVCTYYNDTVGYKNIDDPFADGPIPVGPHEAVVIPTNLASGLSSGCPVAQSREPLICEEQAMRGCDFADGIYPLGQSPCDINQLQLRLKSDFFLKANDQLRPHAEAFAANADLLATEFGVAYRKVTHLGLERCGLSGHGCRTGTVCVAASTTTVGSSFGSPVCILDDAYVEEVLQEANNGDSTTMSKNTVRIILAACAVVVFVSVAAVVLLFFKMNRLIRAVADQHRQELRHYHHPTKKLSSSSDETSASVTNDGAGGRVPSSYRGASTTDDDSDDVSEVVPPVASNVAGYTYNGKTTIISSSSTTINNTGRGLYGSVWEC